MGITPHIVLRRDPPDDAVGIRDPAAIVAVARPAQVLHHGSASRQPARKGRLGIRHIDMDMRLNRLWHLAHHDDAVIDTGLGIYDA